MSKPAPRIAILMGSDSDWPVMEEAHKICQTFSIPTEVRVLSAHRRPLEVAEYALQAHRRGIQTIIAGAGGAAHLAGVVAAHTHLPVIAVPILSKDLGGLDSLLSMVQMPSGVPVATVGINRATNAGLLALQVLAVADAELAGRLQAYKEELRAKGEKADRKLAAAIGQAAGTEIV